MIAKFSLNAENILEQYWLQYFVLVQIPGPFYRNTSYLPWSNAQVSGWCFLFYVILLFIYKKNEISFADVIK